MVVCRHAREKEVDRVLRIFAQYVYPKVPGATLTLVGDGPESDALKRDGQTAVELGDKEILVVGGADASDALVGGASTYNPARLETDKADYQPDDEVMGTGTGWKAGETIWRIARASDRDRRFSACPRG